LAAAAPLLTSWAPSRLSWAITTSGAGGLVHRSAITQRQKLLGRQQGSFRALARGFQDPLAEYGHGVWIPPVASW
jgi:hypothetical protein